MFMLIRETPSTGGAVSTVTQEKTAKQVHSCVCVCVCVRVCVRTHMRVYVSFYMLCYDVCVCVDNVKLEAFQQKM